MSVGDDNVERWLDLDVKCLLLSQKILLMESRVAKLLVASIPDAFALSGATRCDFSCPCMVDLRTT